MIHEYWDSGKSLEMIEAQPIPLSKGTELAFEPGARHIMAMGVSPELSSGDTTEVTLTVSGGDSVTFTVLVQAAGEAEG